MNENTKDTVFHTEITPSTDADEVKKADEMPADADWVLVGRASLSGRRTADVMRELRYLVSKCGSC